MNPCISKLIRECWGLEKKLDYEITLKIELLNEFSNIIHARLVKFVLKNGIDTNDKTNPYIILLDQLSELLDKNLFEMSRQELDGLKTYWGYVDILVKKMTQELVV